MKQIITKRPDGTVKVQTKNEKPTRTKQSYRDMVNVNKMIKKHGIRQVMAHSSMNDGIYGDFAGIGDFTQQQNAIINAQNQFLQLPSCPTLCYFLFSFYPLLFCFFIHGAT